MKKIFIPILMLCLGFATQVQAEDTDLTTLNNVIYVEPMTVDVEKDGTEIYLSFQMKNSAEIRGFQFDMYLPAGMEPVLLEEDGEEYYDYGLTAARLKRNDNHTLSYSVQDDGAYRFLCGSMGDFTFKGNSGEVAFFLMSVKGMEDGNYPIILKNMKLTETDISVSYEVSEVETTLTLVGTSVGVKSLNTENLDNSPVYDLQGRKVANTSKKGLYIKNGKKEIVR